MVKSIALILLIVISSKAYSQDFSIEDEESAGANTLFAETIEHFKQHPVNLNVLETSELVELAIVSQEVIDKIKAHRAAFGDFIHVLELQQCDLTLAEIKHLLPYVFVPLQTQSISVNKHIIVMTALHQKQKNNKNTSATRYSGGASTTILRYRGQFKNNVNVSFTGEKDRGEAYFESNPYTAFDFNSGSIQFNNIKGNTSMILGDYTCDFGQGLTLGSGMRIGKSSRTVQTNKSSFGLKPYRSVTEFGFNRGVALSMVKNQSRYHFWLHRKGADATYQMVDGEREFRNLSKTGLHRTETEIKNKNSIMSCQIGFNYTVNVKRMHMEYTGVFTKYNGRFTAPARVYQRFKHSGQSYGKHGISYRYALANGYLFGETTICSNRKMGNLHGLVVGLDKQLSMTTLFRCIQPGFLSIGSASFTEASDVNNESGLYIGLQFKPFPQTTLSIYADYYWFPWLKSATLASTLGTDYFMRGETRISKTLSWHIQIKYEKQDKHVPTGLQMKSTGVLGLLKIRVHLSHTLSKKIKLQTRFARNTTRLHGNNAYGSVLYQDIQFEPANWPINCYFRIASAHIEDYAVRIYTYENDLAYRFSLPSFTNNQVRSYLLLRWTATKQIDFWVKYIRTHKNIRNHFGSHGDSVSSPDVSNIHFQLRVKL